MRGKRIGRAPSRRWLLILIVVGVLLATLTTTAWAMRPPQAHPQGGARVMGRGIAYAAHLVVGVPREDVGNIQDAGAIDVIPGGPNGLTGEGARAWDQDSDNVYDVSEADDLFGASLAIGDFNGDGVPDLAIGSPGEDISGRQDAGAVHVLYGVVPGFFGTQTEIWAQGFDGLSGQAEAYDYFGSALAAGDFNNDGYTDLAIGVSGEDVGNIQDAGAVHVLYGSAQGLTSVGDQLWDQNVAGVDGQAEEADWFGYALATGDFNRDGYADLAIGIPREDRGSIQDSGAVQILYGSAQGLQAAGDQLWDQDEPGMAGAAERGDWFGWALASGDFNGDGYADLAIGVPHEDVGDVESAGAVHIMYGSAAGLSATGNMLWDQGPNGAEANDNFGASLATGYFDSDRFMDLAAGAPGESILGHAETGVILAIYGSPSGLDPQREVSFSRAHFAGYQARSRFGEVLASGDFNGDGLDDLAIGAPLDDVGSKADGGAVFVLYGGDLGLTDEDAQTWTRDSPGVPGRVEAGDQFGGALAALPLVCPQDPYEPNDQPDDAYDATSDFNRSGGLQVMDDAYICPWGDEDYYEFPVQAGETIHVSLSSLPADYDLYLYDATGALVDFSRQGGTRDETISHEANMTGKYQVRVKGATADAWTLGDGYSMQLYTEAPAPAPTCADRAYEPNEDFDSAAAILPGTIEGYICTADDEDWYRFEARRGSRIQVTLTNLPQDYDMSLYDPTGTLLARSEESGTADERIVHEAGMDGEYRVRIFGYQGAYDADTPYRLQLSVQMPDEGRTKLYVPLLRKMSRW